MTSVEDGTIQAANPVSVAGTISVTLHPDRSRYSERPRPGDEVNHLSDQLDGQGKQVTNTMLSQNDTRLPRINFNFASEPQDTHVDASIKLVFVNSRCLHQVFAGQWP